MKTADYANHDATGLAELVRNGDVTASELLDAAHRAIDEADTPLSFLAGNTYKYAERAIAAGLPQGPFTGVPILKKDLGQACKGIQVDSGSWLGMGFTPDFDSNLYQRIKNSGLVIVGRSTVPSFGGSGTTEPACRHAPTRNPWDLDRSSGGSSGGAAAAVASGAVPIAHASDGGGSIRIPAALCGLVGHKPTRGLLPCGPEHGELFSGLAVDGVVTRTTRDTAAFLDAVAGPDPGCRYFTPPPAASFLSQLDHDPGRLRIALNVTAAGGLPVDPACRLAAEQAARLLSDAGHEVEQVTPFPDFIDTGIAGGYIWAAHLAVATRSMGLRMGRQVTPESVESSIFAMAEAGRSLKAAELDWAYARVNEFSRAFGQFFEEWDLLLEPATSVLAPLLGSIPDNKTNVTVEEWGAAIWPLNCFTNRANKAGLPAMVVPWDVTESGLPVGIQIMGQFGADLLCLQVGRLIERARPWLHRRPPVFVGRAG